MHPKIPGFIALLFSLSTCLAQTDTINVYVSEWGKRVSTADSAMYAGKGWKEGGVWRMNAYFKTGLLRQSGTYADSAFSIHHGELKQFTEDGTPQYKAVYFTNLVTDEEYYYPSGKLKAKGRGMEGLVYAEDGSVLKDAIFRKEAVFPGGEKAWITYLGANLNNNIPVKKKAPAGRYTVIVRFIIDKKGDITEVHALNDPGYGTVKEAVRVISKGGKWAPAIQFGEPVIYRLQQNITFVVEEK